MFFLAVSISVSAQSELKRSNLFDFNWKFHRGGALGAEMPAFDDSNWRGVDIPHDWSIEDLPGTNSPFNRDAISQVKRVPPRVALAGTEKHLPYPET